MLRLQLTRERCRGDEAAVVAVWSPPGHGLPGRERNVKATWKSGILIPAIERHRGRPAPG